MPRKITENTTYVGHIDWEIRHFHGEQLSTYHGTSYNSYLIQDGAKTALVDTVWGPYSKEFIAKLQRTVGIENIDYMIALHGEPDHSQALSDVMAIKPDLPIYCTENATRSLKGFHHKDWDFHTIKTGDTLDLGNGKFTFVEAPMLHWPDQMMAYYDRDKILFSSDPFGHHFASDQLFTDKVDASSLIYESVKYYANIVSPYSAMVIKKLKEFAMLNLPLEMIAPAHGLIWRKVNTDLILKKYAEWADNFKKDKITIVYDTMYESTRKLAIALGEGIREADRSVEIRLFNSSLNDIADINTQIFASKGVLFGSPTYNSGVLNSTAGILEELKGFRFTGKKAAAFGSYGWAPMSVKIIAQKLRDANFQLFEPEGLSVNWNPTEEKLAEARKFGADFAKFCNE
ncbi:MAG: MBL fold metallo-hydrolase [Ignavibacteria bacterium]|jgi:flavorubredoxin|nr:MBL fold metallo-hydrolase [Ignavibacteria bacterium]